MTGSAWTCRYVLTGIALAVFVVTLQTVRINRPFVGHFASYQGTVMASIARNMVRENFSDLFLPKTDALFFQPQRSLHLNQYPLPSLIAAACLNFFGGNLEFWGRFQAIVFNFSTIALIMLVATRLFDVKTGFMAGVFYGLSPYTLIYGQAFMSEAAGVFFLMASLALIANFKDPSSIRRIALAGFLFALSLLNRVHFVLFFPAYFFLLFKSCGNINAGIKKGALFTLLCFSLPVLWYGFTFLAPYFTSNIHTTLFMQIGPTDAGSHASGFQYINRILEVVCVRMLTPILVPFFLFGFMKTPHSTVKRFLFLSIAGGGITLFLIPAKVIAHDFYLYGAFPFAAILIAHGYWNVLSFFKKYAPLVAAVSLLLYAAVSIKLCLPPLFKMPASELQAVRMAERIRPLLAPNDILIVGGPKSPVFCYYIDHPSWSLDLDALGEPMAYYLKSAHAPKSFLYEVSAIEEARKDPRKWFDYLRNRGATTIVFPEKKQLDSHPQFKSYLNSSSRVLSNDADPYFVAQIIPRQKST